MILEQTHEVVGVFLIDPLKDKEELIQNYVEEASETLGVKLRSYMQPNQIITIEGEIASLSIDLKDYGTSFVVLPGIVNYVGKDITGTEAKRELLLLQHLAESVPDLKAASFDAFFGDSVAGDA